MAYCLKCNKHIPDSYDHFFCGYSFCFQYCEDCCPKEVDGMECDACKENDEQNTEA